MCCLAQAPQSASGSSQVLQKWVALTCKLSFKQGLQKNSFSCCNSELKNKNKTGAVFERHLRGLDVHGHFKTLISSD